MEPGQEEMGKGNPGRENYGSKTQRQQRTGYMQRTVVPRQDEVLRAEASEAKKVGYIMVASVGS